MYQSDKVIIGPKLTILDFISVAREDSEIEFSQDFVDRVNSSRQTIEKWISDEKVMYGITTGFGALCTEVISKKQASKLQKNIIMSHSTSIGEPLSIEATRAVMLMIIQNTGQGYSGIRLKTLELLKEFLNRGLVPYAPKEGSVGYLTIEAHIALVLIGEGKAYYGGSLYDAKEALKLAGLNPIELAAKEGLALISGTTSVTALGLLALNDMLNATKNADIISAMTLEASKGNINAFDDRIMRARPHTHQSETAKIVRNILKDSEIAQHYKNHKLQDALSIRCIPQLHGAVKKVLYDTLETLEIELNSCCDNPIVWSENGVEEVLSCGNPDSSYVGIEMDSATIAATNLAKMSERRNNRLIDENLSGNPWFLISEPGLNSGLMIPHYTQAGLLNDMKTLSHPATVDSISTCGNQEDYVGMGYNASKKALEVVDKLEYILAIELLSAYQSYRFLDKDLNPSTVTNAIIEEIKFKIPILDEDAILYPYITYLKELIHSRKLIDIMNAKIKD